jgi:RNA polymerase sigma-70 factor (ECF subfamily)
LFLRITRDQSASEDLVQELFLRVWNHRRDFDVAKGSLGAWITSIARNMAIDYVRSAQARFQSKLRPIDQTDARSFSYKEQEPEKTLDTTRQIREALQNLNENQRRALELAYFEGCSQTEIALRLQEPLGTVKSWIRSALNRLRVEARREVAR